MPPDSPFENPPVSGAFAEKAEMPYNPGSSTTPKSDIGRALHKHQRELLLIDGVVGVGVGQDRIGGDAITVYIRDSGVKARVPSSLEGYSVQTEITGVIEPLPKN